MTRYREQRLWDAKFIKTIKLLAPGTLLREGLENILRAKMGALVVVGDKPTVMELVNGGFAINCDFSPSGFYELAKMDGALVLSEDSKYILNANAHLVPDASVHTIETGTRHRTAERMARQTGALVIAISQRRNVITIYQGNLRYTLKDLSVILNRTNQAMQTMERYNHVLTKGLNALTALEFDNLATLHDVATVIIRAEQVSRIADEIRNNIIELGNEGRLLNMQMEELLPAEDEEILLLKDYCFSSDPKIPETVRESLAALPEENLEPVTVCRMLGFTIAGSKMTEIPVVPRGYRVLRRVSRLPMAVIENLVAQYKTLHPIYNATLAELDKVEGIGEVRAKAIKDGLKMVREQALLDHHG